MDQPNDFRRALDRHFPCAMGEIHRPGLLVPSKASGALVAFRDELLGGTLKVSLDRFDIEQSYLKQRLLPMIEYGRVPDLAELTRLTADAIEQDTMMIFEHLLEERTSEGEDSMIDIAFVTGIQIHGPAGVNYVSPRRFELTIDGERVEQDWTIR